MARTLTLVAFCASLDLAKASHNKAMMEDRTDNPLASLASAAGLNPTPGLVASPRNGAAGQTELPTPEAIFRQQSAECLLRACEDLQSDDSDSDEESPTKSGRQKRKRSNFPKPDFDIFKRPPSFDTEGAAGEFDQIMDLDQRLPDNSDEPTRRAKNKKAKRAAASAAMAKAKEIKRKDKAKKEGSPPERSPERDGPSEKMIGRLTVSERKAKIAKFMDKRTRRKWDRKVEYECRKKLATNRVRVAGRFA